MTKIYFVLMIIIVIVIVIITVNSKKMFLKTTDGVNIAYDLLDVANPKGYVVLIHMMPAAKESWNKFTAKLQNAGYSSIAIDLRGHGQSDGGPNGYKDFSNAEHQNSIFDVDAAVKFLTKDVGLSNVYFVGASIGANLSLQYLAEHPGFQKAVLLSAGLNYRGIQTKPLYKKLKLEQKLLAIASEDDGVNAEENIELFGADNLKLLITKSGGHGTDILKNHPELTEKILQFFNS